MTGVNMVEGRGEITIVHLIYGGGGGVGQWGEKGGGVGGSCFNIVVHIFWVLKIIPAA